MHFIKIILKKILPETVIKKIRRIKILLKLIINHTPTKARIEASTLCQLNCMNCYMRESNFGTMGKGYLKFSDFKTFCLNNKNIKDIELSNSGEIFLNPELLNILEYACKNNIALHADNGVNFNTISDEILEALVKYQFRSITFSIDGSSQKTYSLYRVNGNFDIVIENIKKLNEYKRKYNSKIPTLKWGYIIMEHNENDIVKAKAMAKDLNMIIHFKLPLRRKDIFHNKDMLIKETGLKYLTNKEASENNIKYRHGTCYQLWFSPQINYDGRLLGCCNVYMDDFGVNVFEVGLKKAINSEKYKLAKKMLMGKVDVPINTKNIPCVNCGIYKRMKKTGIYIT